MKSNIKRIFISGFIFLIPFLFILLIFRKIWHYWKFISHKLIVLFDLKSTVSQIGYSLSIAIFFILIVFLFGILIQFAFLEKLNTNIDNLLKTYFPAYSIYKQNLKFKLNSSKEQTYVKFEINGFTKIGSIIDEDTTNFVLFVAISPNIDVGEIYIIQKEKCKKIILNSNDLDLILSKRGKGLLKLIE